MHRMHDQRLDKRSTSKRHRRHWCIRGLCQNFADNALFSGGALPSGSRIVRPFRRFGMTVVRVPVMFVFMLVSMSHATRASRVMLATADRSVQRLHHERGGKEGSRK